jgi:hypothetical protein
VSMPEYAASGRGPGRPPAEPANGAGTSLDRVTTEG